MPLKFVYKFKNPSFVGANSQFIVIDRKAYFEIGGYEKVKNKVVEDRSLARFFKKNNFKIATFFGGDLIFAHMDDDFGSVVKGFSKNFFDFLLKYLTSIFLFSVFMLIVLEEKLGKKFII